MSTFLLVHGAWHSGRCWERVVPLLEAAGHRVFAPSLTGYGDKAHLLGPEVGLDTHVDDVVGLITGEDLSDVVLVGHSYAGLVISSAANRIPERVAHLVYLDAMVPEDGESAIDVQPMTQHLIELAETSGSGWRVPPMPERPAPFGLFGVTIPEEHGGLGLDLLTYVEVIEELSYGWMSLTGILNTHTMAATLLLAYGSEDQRSRWLPSMATGEMRAAMSLSEAVVTK